MFHGLHDLICFQLRYVRLSSYRTRKILNLLTGDSVNERVIQAVRWTFVSRSFAPDVNGGFSSHSPWKIIRLILVKGSPWNAVFKLEASARLLGILGLGSKLYPGNMQRMLNKDLTRFMQSLSRELQNRASKRKALLAGWTQIVLKFFTFQPSVKTILGKIKNSMTFPWPKHFFFSNFHDFPWPFHGRVNPAVKCTTFHWISCVPYRTKPSQTTIEKRQQAYLFKYEYMKPHVFELRMKEKDKRRLCSQGDLCRASKRSTSQLQQLSILRAWNWMESHEIFFPVCVWSLFYSLVLCYRALLQIRI